METAMDRKAVRCAIAAGAAVAFLPIGVALAPSPAAAQGKLAVDPVVEMKLSQLPSGPLYWRREHFPNLQAAKAAAGPTSLAAEISGKVWLFTLGPKGGSS